MHAKSEEGKNNLGQFEQWLERLEQIVATMERGELTLEQTLEHYEEGMKVAKLCAARLGDAEKRIEALSGIDDKGRGQWQPLNLDLESDQ